MARRYCGSAIVTFRYDDRGDFPASVAIDGRKVWAGRLPPPAAGSGAGVACDHASAYDQVAHAVLSFASQERPELADEGLECDAAGAGWKIRRSRSAKSPPQ